MNAAPHSAARTLLALPSDPNRVGHDWLGTLATHADPTSPATPHPPGGGHHPDHP